MKSTLHQGSPAINPPPSLERAIVDLCRAVAHGAAPSAAPLRTSQRNCELIGLTRRDFLDVLRRTDCPLAVSKVGKLRLVETAALLHWLDSLAIEKAAAPEPRDEADALLEGMGLRVVRGGAR